MAIIATLIKAEEHKTYWKMEVEYNDDGEIAVETFRFSGNTTQSLINYVSSKVAQYEDIKAFDFTALIGASVDITPDPVVPPTQDELDEAQWFEDWNSYKQMKQVVDAGLEADTHPSYVAIIEAINTGWKTSYLGKI